MALSITGTSRCAFVLLLFSAGSAADGGSTPLSLQDILLHDTFIPSSSRCDELGNATAISFNFTSSAATSRWSEVNQGWEQSVFLAEMRHDDASGKNRTWTARFGTGGNIYSLVGPFGEAIPPQTLEKSPWIDEVTQCVAVDQLKNRPAMGRSYFIHQAGAYLQDEDYMPPPFFSPNVARSCAGSECRFVSWGTQAHVPTVFKSDLLYIHRYRDCGDGVLEYTQGFQNVGDVDTGDVLTYLNVPWGGVRTSSLPETILSGPGGRMLEKEFPLHGFGTDKKLPNLNTMGGFTTFATDLPVPEGKDDLPLPCYRFGDDGAEEVKDPCAASDVDESGYTRYELVFNGPNPCRYFPPHSNRFGGYYVTCRIKGDDIPRIDGCRQCASRLRFKSTQNGESIIVTDVVHWSFGNGRAYFSSPNATAKEINEKFKNSDEIRVTIDSPGREEDSLALAYVHGVDREFDDAGNDWFQMPGRARFGKAGRDFTVFTINARIKLEPGNTYFNRQYLITDRFSNMEDHANEWVNETVADVLTGNDLEGRRVEMWEEDGVIGVAFAAEQGGTSTTCARGRSMCVGSSVHSSGTKPFFSITCGDRSYVGPDMYALAAKRTDTNDPIRSYACGGEDDSATRPTWTLLGYFPADEDGCSGMIDAKLDTTFCEPSSVEDGVNREESKREGDVELQLTSRPTLRGEGRNIFDHSGKIPSVIPGPPNPSQSPSSSPVCFESLLANDSIFDEHCGANFSIVFMLGINASLNSSNILNEGPNSTMLNDVLAALRNVVARVVLKYTNGTPVYTNVSTTEEMVIETSFSENESAYSAYSMLHVTVIITEVLDYACPLKASQGLSCIRMEVSVDITVEKEEILPAVGRIQVELADILNTNELLAQIEAVNPDTKIIFAAAVAVLTATSIPSTAPSFSASGTPSSGSISESPSVLPAASATSIPSTAPPSFRFDIQSEGPVSESSILPTASPDYSSGVTSFSGAPKRIRMINLVLFHSVSLAVGRAFLLI